MSLFAPPPALALRRRARSRLFGPSGKPLSYLYESPTRNTKAFRPRQRPRGELRYDVNEYERSELLDYSRLLVSQIDILAAAVEQKNNWSFGDSWEPHYTGNNEKWGQEAEEFLIHQFYPTCNLRGPIYDMRTSMKLSGKAWDVDGDDVMVLSAAESGFPMLSFFPATRIGNGNSRTNGGTLNATVRGGPFDGALIFDGIITDRNLRPIGIRLVDPDKSKWQDISTFSADLSYEPAWCDQGRGIPRIAVSMLRWMNIQDIDEFLQRGIKRASSVGLKFKTEEGEAGLGNELITEEDNASDASGERKIYYEEIEGGEGYYLNSETGEDIEELHFKNPHQNTEMFIQRLQRGALATVGWFYELLHLNEGGRAPSRLLCDLANQSIWDRQATGWRRWKRAIVYAIAKGMKEGFISRNDDGRDPYMWEPGLPKQISVDAGNDQQADREALKLGITTKSIVTAKAGYHRKTIDRERLVELKATAANAQELREFVSQITNGNTEIPFEKAMEWVEQRSPNPISQLQPQKPQQKPESK